MTEENKDKLQSISRAISGTIIECSTMIEQLINGVIGYYYCNDDNKIDEFIGFIQEININSRIDCIEIILIELDSKIVNDEEKLYHQKHNFKYLHETIYKHDKTKKIKSLISNIIKSLDLLNAIRNSFAHGIIELIELTNNGNTILDYSFKIKDFKPLTNSGKKKYIYSEIVRERIDLFTKQDYENIMHDIGIIKKVLVKSKELSKNAYTRIPITSR